jgi:hypothetical protein
MKSEVSFHVYEYFTAQGSLVESQIIAEGGDLIDALENINPASIDIALQRAAAEDMFAYGEACRPKGVDTPPSAAAKAIATLVEAVQDRMFEAGLARTIFAESVDACRPVPLTEGLASMRSAELRNDAIRLFGLPARPRSGPM